MALLQLSASAHSTQAPQNRYWVRYFTELGLSIAGGPRPVRAAARLRC